MVFDAKKDKQKKLKSDAVNRRHCLFITTPDEFFKMVFYISYFNRHEALQSIEAELKC